MYKHLIVAIDGSETALNALKHACELSKLNQAQLTLVHVANPTEYMTLVPGYIQQESHEDLSEEQGSAILKEALQAAQDFNITNIHTHLLVSASGAKDMAYELIQYADKVQADLLVLGTHGRSGLMHLLMGSFTETVMRQTHLPLLVIRHIIQSQK